MDELHPELRRARFGDKPDQDHFLAFWLRLMTDQRLGGSPKRVQRSMSGLFRGKTVRGALDAVGEGPVLEQLADAARRYVETCLSDPRYRTTLFGMKHLDDAELRAKTAGDVVTMLDALASVPAEGPVAGLPAALIDGALAAMPGAEEALRDAARGHSGAADLLEQVLDRP